MNIDKIRIKEVAKFKGHQSRYIARVLFGNPIYVIPEYYPLFESMLRSLKNEEHHWDPFITSGNVKVFVHEIYHLIQWKRPLRTIFVFFIDYVWKRRAHDERRLEQEAMRFGKENRFKSPYEIAQLLKSKDY